MKIEKQILINSVGVIILMFSQWLISVILVRFADYETAGIFSLAMSVSNVFYAVENYQMRNFQLSDSTGRYTPAQYRFARWMVILIALFMCGIYLIFISDYNVRTASSIFIYLLYSSVYMISDTLLIPIQKADHLEITGYSNIMRGFFAFFGFMAVFAITKSIILALSAMAVTSLVIVLAYDISKFRHFAKYEPINMKSDFPAAVYVLKTAVWLMLALTFQMAITAIPRSYIDLYMGTEMVGYFSTIFTPTVLITTVVPAIVTSYIPQMAEDIHQGDTKSLLRTVSKPVFVVLAITILAIIGALLVGRFFMRLVFGEQILQYYTMMYPAIIAISVNALGLCAAGILTVLGCNKSVALSAGISTMLIFVLSKWFLLHGTVYTAAYVLIAAYAFQLIFQMFAIFNAIRGIHKQKLKNQ